MDTWSVPGYTEIRELGAGASGRVVRAVHDTTGVPVAVKHLSENLRSDADFLHTFRDEARLLGALESPYVTRLYEYVEGPDGAAIVMELVDGLALRELLREQGPVGPEAALAILKGSLLGLAAAHAAGVVHRDYKPANVLVAADGTSKLVDFGIATGHGADAPAAGTPAYMAPEQWSGAPASPAADVYAATATFYECLTGRKPFSGDSLAELAVHHVDSPVPEDGVPEPLRPLVRSGMAKAPEERPQEAAAFVRELELLAGAAYGPDWEERGRGRLASLAALLPLLFPTAGDRAETSTDLASTSLGQGDGGAGWKAWLPGGAGAGAATASALLLALILVLTQGVAGAGAGGGGTAPLAAATTSLDPEGDGDAGPGTTSPSPSSPPSPSPSPSPSLSLVPPDVPGSPSPGPGSPGPSGVTPDDPHDPHDPTTPDPGGPGPSPAVPGGPSSLAPPHPGGGDPAPGTPSPSPPTGPQDPGVSRDPDPKTPEDPPATAPPAVKGVTVSGFRQTGPATATATVEIAADGTGPLTVVLTWSTGDTATGPADRDGATRTFRRSGATRYTLTVDHTFQKTACYWHVSAATDPASADGGSSARLLTQGCDLR
ncbi:serine/threonine protein kinase [Streptomyces sp. MUM 203J]|uniref:serine/threonine-protein kinase n=1 Tax=Streptomyces sp. MUM 203J TaxID=2791990 RepID=UPI001F049C9B|nr:serine/threonine-protein kinase [Streptomyces sp. MUM 203J]MCH0540807.1 serine/threonine protein kinase [Streptomyces sp. MUM 203J]